jgi:hypothetical protein
MLIQGLVANISPDKTKHHRCYERALGILEGARKMWPEVSTDGPGSVFKVTFIWGVRRLWAQAYQQVGFGRNIRFLGRDVIFLGLQRGGVEEGLEDIPNCKVDGLCDESVGRIGKLLPSRCVSWFQSRILGIYQGRCFSVSFSFALSLIPTHCGN